MGSADLKEVDKKRAVDDLKAEQDGGARRNQKSRRLRDDSAPNAEAKVADRSAGAACPVRYAEHGSDRRNREGVKQAPC